VIDDRLASSLLPGGGVGDIIPVRADARGEDGRRRADRRDAEGQKALFTEDTHFLVYMEGEGSEPTQELNGREALTPVFDDLNRYDATTHFNGQSTVTLDGDRAIGESYCLAHHLYTEDGERKLMVASIRYLDTFVKSKEAWLFAERKLYVDWTEIRSSHP
jgi:SnoaL-like protein